MVCFMFVTLQIAVVSSGCIAGDIFVSVAGEKRRKNHKARMTTQKKTSPRLTSQKVTGQQVTATEGGQTRVNLFLFRFNPYLAGTINL